MHELAERLLRTIRKQELLRAGDRVAVAVSGGADSVALLCLLEELRGELGIVLSVAHVNHKLRSAESDADERFVAELAAARGLDFLVRTVEVGRERSAGIESAARRARYGFFRELASEGRATKIATAHTLDDQAETVLLRMFRGTGIRGLAGIHPRLRLEHKGRKEEAESIEQKWHTQSEGRVTGEVIRPLLGFRRAELRDYLRARGESWREDSSNQDVTFLRNRVRQLLLPLIAEEFGEAAIEHMAELAEIARAEEEQWSVDSGQWAVSTQYPVPSTQSSVSVDVAGKSSGVALAGATLDVERLLALPLAAGRRLVRAWIEANAPEVSISFRLIEEILELARGAAGKKFELPGAAAGRDASGRNPAAENARPKIVRRARKNLVLEWEAGRDVGNYEYALAVPGEVAIPELGACIEARMVDVESVPDGERSSLLDPERVGTKVLIRNWRAGDRYWPAHTAAEKKVKDLLSDRHATGAEKKLWPVVVSQGGELAWVRGFAAPAAMRARTGKAIWIREMIAGSR